MLPLAIVSIVLLSLCVMITLHKCFEVTSSIGNFIIATLLAESFFIIPIIYISLSLSKHT